MPRLISGSTNSKGDKNIIFSQEDTGELSASMKGDCHGTLTTIAVDHDGNQMNYASSETLNLILFELQRISMQLALITDNEIGEDDIQ